MDAEKMAMQRRIDTLDQYATRLHAALTEAERENARLKAELETVKRERDEAMKAIKFHKFCIDCAHSTIIFSSDGTWVDCPKIARVCSGHELWEWRGLCEENGGAEDA